jgi:hypothetical protein
MKKFLGLRMLASLVLLAGCFVSVAHAADPPLVRTKQSGNWSSPETWDGGKVPTTGDRVVIGADHSVLYDYDSRNVIRLVQVAGKLDFARDKNTRLEAGLILVTPSEVPSEEGFDCHADPVELTGGRTRPTLLIGQPGAPILRDFTATIRLHYVEGMDKLSCPAIVNCAGRLEIHGAPMQKTWVKLKRPAAIGTESVAVMEAVEDWKPGDNIIVTGTLMQRDRRGSAGGFLDNVQTEQRIVRSVGDRDFTGGFPVRFDKPLLFNHYADGEFQGEVANLTRNVVIESADPDGVRGHTMYHQHSAGSVSYAEFRHLGKKNELGRYSLHFHLCGDTMRGSSVIGASIWDSHNRWITIHGTDAMVVRDCVGYKSIGHGYFLEDGSEINNILDHNLAAVVAPGNPLPKQVIPFDLNRGAGFWWANCQNSFTRNCAAECAEYGYRFDCKKTADFDPVRPIRQPDGSEVNQDTRIMPFVRFENNEAHSMRFFCLNLRGVVRPEGGGLNLYDQNVTLAKEAAEAMPDPRHPFWIRDFKAWEANWSVHLGTTGVFIDGLNSFRNDVAIWRSIMDRSGYRRMVSKEMRVNDIHNPLSLGMIEEQVSELSDPQTGGRERRGGSFRGISSFSDDMPPTTVITRAIRTGNMVYVQGSVADTSDIKYVKVNDRPARSLRDSFAEWEIALEAPADQPFSLSAMSEDVGGHIEQAPHVVALDAIFVPTEENKPAVDSAALDQN